MSRTIPLTQGFVAIVDDEDFERVNAFKWYAHAGGSKCGIAYAQRTVRITRGRGGKSRKYQLHRFILGCEHGDGKIVDHIDGNPLNNQRSNLRVTDARGNATNITSSAQQKRGGFKGVTWHPKGKKWQAQIGAGAVKPCGRRRSIYLGLYADPVDAARAYDAAALKYHGEFAALNFPLDGEQEATAAE